MFVVGLLAQDCELKESDYDYSSVQAGQVSIGTGRRARLAKRIEWNAQFWQNPEETQPLAVIKRGIDVIG